MDKYSRGLSILKRTEAQSDKGIYSFQAAPRDLGEGQETSLSLNFPHSKVSSLNCLLVFPGTVKAAQESGDHQDAKSEDSMRDRGWCLWGKGLEKGRVPCMPLSPSHTYGFF